MAGSTISGTVTSTVTLDSVTYPSPLTVTSTGDVAVSAFSAIGIYAPAGSGTLINDGTVTGGAGTVGTSGRFGGNGGTSVELLSGSTAVNNGQISGGAGGNSTKGSGNGGVGVSVATGGILTNQATITGGSSGLAEGDLNTSQGCGGAGVQVTGGSVTNSGTITGGYSFGYREAGSGALLLAGTLSNTGIIAGGRSTPTNSVTEINPRLEDGVYLSATATLTNSGTIVGGYAYQRGGAGIYVAAGGTLVIAGLVVGGASEFDGDSGVQLAHGGSLDNTGTVVGGVNGGMGVYLANGGTLTNGNTIIGGAGLSGDERDGGNGVVLAQGGVLINAAFISGGSGVIGNDSGAGGTGVVLNRGGTLTNESGAIITGGVGGNGPGFGGGAGTGVNLTGGTLTNAGTITGGSGIAPNYFGGNGGTGVSLTAGAMLTNTGSIGGGEAGLFGFYNVDGGSGAVIGSSASASTLVNSGVITGNADYLAPGGKRYAHGTIAGGAGVSVGSGDTLINSGLIVAGAGVYVAAGGMLTTYKQVSGGDGVAVASGGTVLNTGTVISGVGVYVGANATLVTQSTISGGIYAGVTADAVLFAAGGTLVVFPGSQFAGQVVANATSADTLELSYLGPGTLSGLGTQIVNFAQVAVVAGTHWTLTGANTIAAGTGLTVQSGATLTTTGTLLNDGSIALGLSRMTVAALAGTGSVAIGADSRFTVQGVIGGGETLTFGGAGAYLHLEAPDSVAGSVTNFVAGETIDLTGIDPATVNYAAGQLTFAGGGDIPLALGNGGTVVASTSADGAEVTVLCFCANTLILTPSGERPVQDLAISDLVTTHRGEARPIVWVGVGKVLATRGQRGAATPVIVRKGALADNVPNRDLRVTKGHAFWFGGALIPVEFLVNHRSIAWDDRAQEVSLYHIELASHDVLVANGAPAESYRDDGNRWLFRNANSGWGLPPQPPCAPVLTGGQFVDAVWRHVLERAGPRPGFPLTGDPDLHLLVDGVRVDGARVDGVDRRGTVCVFALRSRPASLRIVSRAAAPAEVGLARDHRVLGVALRRIALRQDTRFRIIEAADTSLTDGFHPFENADGLRWTDGDAGVPEALFEGFDGPMELVLHLGGTTRYPLFGGAGSTAVAA
jgi:Hint domain